MFKIVFLNQGNVVELYARQVVQGSLFGFIEIEDLVFGARSESWWIPTRKACAASSARPSACICPCTPSSGSKRWSTKERPGRGRPRGMRGPSVPFPCRSFLRAIRPCGEGRRGRCRSKHLKDLERLREIGRIVGLTIQEVEKYVRPGVTTAELDAIGDRFLTANGPIRRRGRRTTSPAPS